MVILESEAITSIEEEIERAGNKDFAESRNKFLGKDQAVSFGTKVGNIRRIVKRFYRQNKDIDLPLSLNIVTKLLSDDIFDYKMAGVFLLGQVVNSGVSIGQVNRLVYRKLNNWALSDALATEVVAKVAKESDEGIKLIGDWVLSDDEWMRRSAIVSLIKTRACLENWENLVQTTISGLEGDRSVYVRKAVAWLKKETKKS